MAKGKILVADDDKDILELLSRALEAEGYEVRTAGDGQKALEAVAAERPDLLVLDGLMPKVSGFDVCKKVKEELFPKSPPKVLLITAVFKKLRQRHDAVRLYKADEVITKPFEVEDFLATVRRLVGG